MSRPGITYQEVANAAIQLQGQNDNPTVDRVREILGTGSKSTIARYLKDWRSKSGYVNGTDSIPHELISIIKGLWNRLQSESDDQINKYQQEVGRNITELNESLSQEQRQNRDLQNQLRHMEEQLHQEKNHSQTLNQFLEEEKRSNAKLSERNERLLQQLNDQKTETDRLHKLLSHVQNNLEHYQASIQKLREEQVLATEKQKAIYEHEINSLKYEINSITELKDRLQRELDQVHPELKFLKEQNNLYNEEKNIYYQQLQEKTIQEAALQHQLTQSHISYKELQLQLENKITLILELEKQLAVITHQLTHAKKSLQNAEDTICILRDEKLYLAQEKAHLEGQFKQFQTNL